MNEFIIRKGFISKSASTVQADFTVIGDNTADSFITNGGNSNQFVKGDGSLDTNAYLTSANLNNNTININAGSALTGGGSFTLNQGSDETITINHADTSTQTSSVNAGRTYIQTIELDSNGHVTDISTSTETVTNTDTTYNLSALDSNTNVIIRLTGSDTTNDDVTLVAGTNITLTPSGSDITIDSDGGELIKVDEGNGDGYILKDRVAGNYGNIGLNAIDFSFSNNSSTTKGATGAFSFAEGFNTVASGPYSHAQGFKTIASGEYSHAKGFDTEASEVTSHAEGSYTRARGSGSHAEGFNTTASGTYSHAEGFDTEASNQNSHAEGRETIASGAFSHAQGYYNYARGVGEFSGGAYGTDYTPVNGGDTEHPTDRLVNYGNGISTSSRDDAFTIYRNGAVRFYRNELSAITNADAGFLIYDSDDNNRPTIHNGTEWKGLAYVDELGSGNTDTKINALGFNSADGVLTATRDDLITVTTNLDGRYSLLNHTHTISDITNFPVDISYFNNDAGYITSFTNSYLDSAGFSTSTGVLSLSRNDGLSDVSRNDGLSDVTVDLDGRYLELNQTTPQTISNGIPLLSADLADFVNENQIVSKKYVDNAINFIADYYFNNTPDAIGGIYYQMTDYDLGEVASSLTTGTLSSGNNQPLFNFISQENIGTDKLNSGVYSVHLHGSKTGTKSVSLYVQIYVRTTGGSETLVGTSRNTVNLSLTSNEFDMALSIPSEVQINPTDRLVVEVFCNVGNSGSNPTVTLELEGNNNSRVSVPIESDVLSQTFVRQDGSKELTDNWDAGSFDITAQGFIGDGSLLTDLNYNNINNTPTLFSGDYNDLSNKPNLSTVATSGDYDDLLNLPTLSTVATSGDYNDLSNLPNLSTVATSGAYADLTGKPNLFSGDYDDLLNLPTLFSGDYNDLSNLPTLFSGDYNDLLNLPTLFSGAYVDLTGKPTLFSGNYGDLNNKPNLSTVATSGAYADLTGKPTLFSGDYDDLLNLPTLFSGNYGDLNNKPNLSTVATSGAYNDLLNLPNLSIYVDKSSNETIGGEKTFTSNSIFNGNIGIGTTSPSTKLDVVGTIKGTEVVDNNGNTLSQKIDSKTINEPNGSDVVANIVSLTQAEYDAATPISTTFYIITD